MTIGELKRVIEHYVDDSAVICIEYMARPSFYDREDVFAVRNEGDRIVFLGCSEMDRPPSELRKIVKNSPSEIS